MNVSKSENEINRRNFLGGSPNILRELGEPQTRKITWSTLSQRAVSYCVSEGGTRKQDG